MAASRVVDLVTAEIASVTTQLRSDFRAAAAAYRAPPPSGTQLLHKFHAARRAVLQPGDVACTDYLAPFLDTIRQEDTSGLVTQRALCAVRAFLSAGLLALDPANEAAAIVSIVHAATYCRFEVTDPAADEVVLMCILQLLVTCVQCPSGGALSDEAVCEVVHSCFRISSQSSLSDLLRHEAESGLRSMVRTLFSRIPAITAANPAAAAAGASDLAHASPAVAARTPWAGQQVAAMAAARADASDSKSDSRTVSQTDSASALAPPVEASVQGEEVIVTLPRQTAPEAGDEAAAAAGGVAAASEGSGGNGDDEASGGGGEEEAGAPCTPPPRRTLSRESAAAEDAVAVEDGAAGAGLEPAAVSEEYSKEGGGRAAPYGVGCLYEVLRFLVGLVDPAEAHNSPPVRAFALAALLAAMQAGGAPLGQTSALSSLLADSLAYSLIANVECAYGTSIDEAPPAEVLSLILKCAQQLLATVGVLADAQQEALIIRVHIALLNSRTLSTDKRLIVLEALPCLLALPKLPLRLFAGYDCNLRRQDLVTLLSTALADATQPLPGIPLDSANLLALEALADVVTASAASAADAASAPPMAAAGSSSSSSAAAAAASSYSSFSAAAAAAAAGSTCLAATPDGPAAAAATARLLLESRSRKARVLEAAEVFNQKPKKGLDKLQSLGLLPTTLDASTVARFLRSTPQLSKAAVGDFLSGPEDLSKAVLAEFTAAFDFGSLEIDGALRIYLQSFRLPGEAQKIDRLMESFAAALFAANPVPFANADAAYVLAFSIIMLNTDLHSPKIAQANKMTLEQFISNNRGINDGKNLPQPYLERVYAAIQTEEIKMSEEEVKLSRGAWKGLGGQPAPQAEPSPTPSAEAAVATHARPEAMAHLADPALRAALFEAVAPATLRALHATLSRAESRDAVRQALEGYERTAVTAAAHGNTKALNTVLAHLAAASSLVPASARQPHGGSSEPTSPKGGSAAAPQAGSAVGEAAGGAAGASAGAAGATGGGAGASEGGGGGGGAGGSDGGNRRRLREKCMLAAAALFSIAVKCAHALRPSEGADDDVARGAAGGASASSPPPDGWSLLVSALLGLHERRLLPNFVCDDPALGRCWDEPPSKPKKPSVSKEQSSSSFFTGMFSYLIGTSAPDESAAKAAQAAEAATRREVAQFGIDRLLDATATLPPASLAALLQALVAAALPEGGADGVADTAPVPLASSGSAGGGGDPVTAAEEPPSPTGTGAAPPPLSAVGSRGGSASSLRAADDDAPTADASRRRRALALQLLGEVVIRSSANGAVDFLAANGAVGFRGVWGTASAAYDAAICESPPLVRAACVALLRICLRADGGETGSGDGGVLDLVMPSLAPVLQLQGALVTPMVDHIAAALEQLTAPAAIAPPPAAADPSATAADADADADADAAADGEASSTGADAAAAAAPAAAVHAIEFEATWRVIIALTAAPDVLASPPAAAHALSALQKVLVTPGGGVALGRDMPAGCFASAVSALLAHAHAEPPPLTHASRAIETLCELQASLPAIATAIAAGEAQGAALPPMPTSVDLSSPALSSHAPWLRVWLPWLRALASLTVASRSAVRDAAIVALQRCLLHSGPGRGATGGGAAVVGAAFEGVIFPLLADLLQRAVGGTLDDERLMLRAVTLLSKTFLHHLNALLTLPQFSTLWLRLLELLQSYLKVPNNETLLEAVPETLKNLLLVMATQGAFESGVRVESGGAHVVGGGESGASLALMTKAVIDSWGVPELAPVWEEAVGGGQTLGDPAPTSTPSEPEAT